MVQRGPGRGRVVLVPARGARAPASASGRSSSTVSARAPAPRARARRSSETVTSAPATATASRPRRARARSARQSRRRTPLASPALRRRAQRVQRPPRVQLAVDAPEPVELAHVAARRSRPTSRGVRRPAGRPARPRRAAPRANRCGVTSARCSSAISSPAARRNPGAAADWPSAQPRAGQRTREHPSRCSSERRRPAYRAPARSPGQAGEREHRARSTTPVAGELAAVVAGVERRRHHQQRTAAGGGRVRAQHLPGLGGVGGPRTSVRAPTYGGARGRRRRTGAQRRRLRRRRTARSGGGLGAPRPAAPRRRLGLGLGRLGPLLGPRLVELDAPFALLVLHAAPAARGSSCPSGP